MENLGAGGCQHLESRWIGQERYSLRIRARNVGSSQEQTYFAFWCPLSSHGPELVSEGFIVRNVSRKGLG